LGDKDDNGVAHLLSFICLL